MTVNRLLAFSWGSAPSGDSRGPSSEFRSDSQKRIDPPKNVLLAHHASHPFHARSALGIGHAECFQNCVGNFLDIVRINQQCAGFELLRRAGEMAKDEHAIFIDAAGTIFLGYQIHSVLERGDESDVALAVVREKVFAIEAAKMILHRQPVAGGEPAVDVADQAVDALLELVIPGNLHPARHHDLNEHHTAAQFRVAFQSVAVCAQPFRNSFTVIEPVHAEDQLAIGKGGAQLLRSAHDRVGHCPFFKRVEIDPNREMPEANLAFFETNQLQFAARNDFRVRHHAPYAPEKVANVAPCLEPKQIELKERA